VVRTATSFEGWPYQLVPLERENHLLNRNFVLIAGITLSMMASSVWAGTIISYTTNAGGTEFVNGVNSITLDSLTGEAATLTFTPNVSSSSGVPSNIDLGSFVLACPTCTTIQSTTFGGFIFDLIVTDTTDGATGQFVGTSTGGTVSINSSTIQINWVNPTPLSFGPGTLNAISGDFGNTVFSKNTSITSIVAPNSGTVPGNTTVQGQISAVPEPAASYLLGGALLGLGVLGRRRFSVK
jgi:hypothetical protein